MPVVTRRFEFDAAHRVLGHEGKCRHLHGHRYVADVTVSAPELDALGRVVDFSVLKERLGRWIDDHWDHNALFNVDDPLKEVLAPSALTYTGKAPYLFLCNPTAENIACDLWHQANVLLPDHVVVQRVRIYETPNCWADYPDVQ